MKLSLTLTLLCLSALPAFGNSILNFNTASNNVNPGDILSVDVTLTSTDNVFGYQFDLLYPTFLSFSSATEEGDFATSGLGGGSPLYDAPDDATGIVTNVLDALIGSDPFSSPGKIVNFQFLVTGTGSGDISLNNLVLTDDSANTLDGTGPANLTITSTAAETTTTPEPATVIPVTLLASAAILFRKRFLGCAVKVKPELV